MCELQHDEDYLKRRDEGVQEFFFRELSVKERAVFWRARRAWFAQKGYTLFTIVEGDPIHAAPDQSSFKLAPCKYGGLTAGGTNTFPYADFWVHSRTNGFTAVRTPFIPTPRSDLPCDTAIVGHAFLCSRLRWPPRRPQVHSRAITRVLCLTIPPSAACG